MNLWALNKHNFAFIHSSSRAEASNKKKKEEKMSWGFTCKSPCFSKLEGNNSSTPHPNSILFLAFEASVCVIINLYQMNT